MDIKTAVQQQFSHVAASYATSPVHVGGVDLDAMLAAVPLRGDERVLDAGSGAGHTALAFASRVAKVVAVDLSDAMLAQGRRLATERGLSNVTFQRGDVERLDAPDASFDLVTSRYSAHHYPRPLQALREIRRVLRPNGTFLLVDVVSPDEPAQDTFLNAIELLRDPSHVRDQTVAQWLALLGATGFAGDVLGAWPLRLEFGSWTARMRTPEAEVAQIKRLMDGAASETRAALAFEADYSFSVTIALIRGQVPTQ